MRLREPLEQLQPPLCFQVPNVEPWRTRPNDRLGVQSHNLNLNLIRTWSTCQGHRTATSKMRLGSDLIPRHWFRFGCIFWIWIQYDSVILILQISLMFRCLLLGRPLGFYRICAKFETLLLKACNLLPWHSVLPLSKVSCWKFSVDFGEF